MTVVINSAYEYLSNLEVACYGPQKRTPFVLLHFSV